MQNGFDFHVTGPPEFVVAVLIVVVLPVYFIPTVIAVARSCRADLIVGIVNLFLGWTVIGWVAALGIAAGSQRRDASS
ncbi:MAG TPA: superinfection immunity protein [Candidatus Dormibacteraeota bacterium]|jgi:hypothetical protein|nr:superinfection immunity protein [Candidatus Dormibacteraeota bacterium]